MTWNNILCHNNIVSGTVSCHNVLSGLLASRDEQPICADDTSIISAGLIIETKNDKRLRG